MKRKTILPCVLVMFAVMGASTVLAQAQAPAGQATPPRMRPFGPEQATGEPNTGDAGDRPTAWASQTPDGREEWLLLTYAATVRPTAVRIIETYNPGAVVRVAVLRENGEEVIAWQGVDPVVRGDGMGVAEIPLNADVTSNRVKIYLDSVNVPGWNEIDAVELIGADGTTQWATAATASSTYAQPLEPVRPLIPAERTTSDEFAGFLGRTVTVYFENRAISGTLVLSGPKFLVVSQRDGGSILVNKLKVLYVEVFERPARQP